MPGVLGILSACRQLDFLEVGQRFLIVVGDPFPVLPEAVALLQLFNTDGGGNVGQIVFKSWIENLIVPRTFLRITLPGIMLLSKRYRSSSCEKFSCLRVFAETAVNPLVGSNTFQ